MDQQPPDGTPSPPSRARGSARAGRALVVGVAVVEALVAAAAAVLSLLSGLQDGSVVLGAAVGGVAAGIAYLLGEAARGFARGRRWPTGIFATVQVLVALVALSLGGRALLTAAENPTIAVVTVTALALAGAGLLGVWWLAGSRDAEGPDDEGPPVL